MGKSRGNLHCVPPLPIMCSWECCLPISLDCPPVQSYHNSTKNPRVHANVTFLINGDESPLLMVCFLKWLEMSPFRWRQFCRCATNRLGHAIPQTQNVFTNGAWFQRSIQLAASWIRCSLRETFFASCLSCTCRALPRANLHISVFCTCIMRPKVVSESSSTKASVTPCKNQKGCVCCYFCMNDRIRNFWEAICISGMCYWFSWFSGTNTVEP